MILEPETLEVHQTL